MRRARWVPFAVLLFAALAQAAPSGDGAAIFSRPYSHYARQEPLADALADFARAQGYRAVVADAVSGKLSGRFEQVAPANFLDSIESAFGVRWYALAGTLHFYRAADTTRVFLPVSSTGAEHLRAQLQETGLISAQLPLETPGRGGGELLAVSGPPDYVRAVEAMAKAFAVAGEKSVMRVFRLKYASADDITAASMGRSVTVPGVASLLRAMVNGVDVSGAPGVTVTPQKATLDKLKGSGLAGTKPENAPPPAAGARLGGPLSIVADPRMNAVVVQDLAARMPYYQQVIAELDRPAHLVEIHAAIVDVDTNFKRDLGVNWQGQHAGNGRWTTSGDVGTDGKTVSGSVPSSPGVFGGAGALLSTIYTHGDSFFIARIQALEEKGTARMLGRPSVLTADNLEATLENTTTYYVPVNGNEEVDLFKVESGTVLRVTPHIIDDGDGAPAIKLAVTVQDGQEGSADDMAGAMAVPPIKQTRINTQAVIDAGQSLLIGGYYFEEKKRDKTGVPGLMNIPLLGALFRSSTVDTRQMERLVLITPRIVRLGQTPALPPQVESAEFGRLPGQNHYAPQPAASQPQPETP